jgi:hypothetical protein
MKTEIGAYEATTHLPELLRQVKAGKRFTITHRGRGHRGPACRELIDEPR